MILEEETFKKFGYYPNDLKQKSNKRVLAICDGCGKIRMLRKEDYRDLCMSCAHEALYTNPEERKKQREAHLGEKNHMFGKHRSEKVKQKLREKRVGTKLSEETKEKIRKAMQGRELNEDWKQKIGEGNKGKTISIEHRKKVSEANRRRIINEATRKKLSIARFGEKNYSWKGGISFEPYCPKFNNDLKERVRAFFDRKCYVCGMTEEENGRKLCIHHVNYDKMLCCNDMPPLFVPLCKKCHPLTNHNREDWGEFFTVSLQYLTQNKCFYTQEEMAIFKKGGDNGQSFVPSL